MTILQINSSARRENSNSRILGQYVADSLGDTVISRDLGQQPMPSISGEDLIAVHGSSSQEEGGLSLSAELAFSAELISELQHADTLVIAAPMYNFGIPVNLKRWVDAICRAGLTFSYTEQGPKGLLDIERAFIVTSSGGTPIGSEMDFASRYLEHIVKFIGVKHVSHIEASGSKGSPEKVIADGKLQIDQLLSAEVAVAAGGED